LWDQYPQQKGLTGAKLIPKKHGMKLLCMAVANGDVRQFDNLYRRIRWSEVRLLQGLQAAASFRDTSGDGNTEGEDRD
jgi:hypothetical protein